MDIKRRARALADELAGYIHHKRRLELAQDIADALIESRNEAFDEAVQALEAMDAPLAAGRMRYLKRLPEHGPADKQAAREADPEDRADP